MNKFALMADEAIRSFSGTDIDSHLSKIANDNNLNPDEHQRLVEEYNVGRFLAKLGEGTQHEEFEVASPISVPADNSADGGAGKLQKAASEAMSYNIDPSMFYLDDSPEAKSLPSLQKVASIDINGGLFSSEEKWKDGDRARATAAKEYQDGIDNMMAQGQRDGALAVLSKEASYSPGVAKGIIVLLAKSAGANEAETVAENCKFSVSEIKESDIEEIPASAIDVIKSIL